MSFRKGFAAVMAAALVGAPGAARAWGVPGCTNLPEYNRALGALQGMTSACDMSVEEARRVIAAHDGVAAPPPNAAPLPGAAPQAVSRPRVRHRHRGKRAHHRTAILRHR
ncbi:hypothetical protein GOFOIKOB_0783 [Methylobacterium tardum]|uniref:Uncharacterized protein n=2 Tax=Methylobacterium tardum TaxID=374432 RepID=A0AA37TKG1_9HYPH|nr:hypothetical protein GOFOIKOB_0783 [Methylobacterium tardum]GLS69603.1 hypothetical protein GCM10007890_16160 [Methylobacterium tardum]